MKDTDHTHRNFIIPAKKKLKKATWCNGFIVSSPPVTDMDRVEYDRMSRVIRYRDKIIKSK
jgi:hypothetical protein